MQTSRSADAKQRAATMRMRNAFENGEDELKVAGFFDAEIVESGHEPGDGDGEDLGPEQGQCRRRV